MKYILMLLISFSFGQHSMNDNHTGHQHLLEEGYKFDDSQDIEIKLEDYYKGDISLIKQFEISSEYIFLLVTLDSGIDIIVRVKKKDSCEIKTGAMVYESFSKDYYYLRKRNK